MNYENGETGPKNKGLPAQMFSVLWNTLNYLRD